MGKLLRVIQELWSRATLTQRVALVAVILVCGASTVLLVNWARQPNFQLLYSGLAPEEAGKIVDKIKEAGVQYELKAGGTAVYVPDEQVHSMRLTMATQGLPSGGQTGYKILDETKLGVTPFLEKVNYLRAIEGELSKTIQFIDGVQGARIHIVQPPKAVFQQQTSPATASVMLQLKPGFRITPSNVAAIVHMISGAVEGLSPDKVTVADSQGKLLTSELGADVAVRGMGMVSEIKAQIEKGLADKALSVLEAALGRDKAEIKVDVVLETDTINKVTKKYGAKGTPTVEENREKTSAPVAPVDPKAAAASKGGNKTSENETRIESVVNEDIITTVSRPGTIKSRSVAAVVELPTEAPAAGMQKLTQVEVEKMIRSAIGMTTTDSLFVTIGKVTPRDKPAVATEPAPQGFFEKYPVLDIAQRVSLGILVIGVLVALRMFTGPRRKRAAALPTAAEASAAMLPQPAADMDVDAMRQRIAHALQDNPNEVKRLFLNWVESGKGGA
ncbi:MAG: flagellar M-ring protein FliF [Planctomycetes bacterium]|nr:flagellar M-ring protein FliF [Planctomycetota bacterium]